MKSLVLTSLCLVILSNPASAQVSESTADWPAWKQISLGTLAAGAVLTTVATVGAANADSNSGDSNSNSGDSQSGGNVRKSQLYVEEIKDELLVAFQKTHILAAKYVDDRQAIASLADEFPALSSYYSELYYQHPEVIEEINRVIEGETLIDRLNTVMMAHLFGDDSIR